MSDKHYCLFVQQKQRLVPKKAGEWLPVKRLVRDLPNEKERS
jgi:hypothetical protein